MDTQLVSRKNAAVDHLASEGKLADAVKAEISDGTGAAECIVAAAQFLAMLAPSLPTDGSKGDPEKAVAAKVALEALVASLSASPHGLHFAGE